MYLVATLLRKHQTSSLKTVKEYMAHLPTYTLQQSRNQGGGTWQLPLPKNFRKKV